MGNGKSKPGEAEAGEAPPPKPPPKPRKSKMFQETALIKEDPPPKPSKPAPKPAAADPAPNSSSESRIKSVNLPSIRIPTKARAKEISALKFGAEGAPAPTTSTVTCITIKQAVHETDKDGQEYYAYVVELRLKSSVKQCKLRYSEFVEFHKEWEREYPGVAVSLPKGSGTTEEDIARRCLDLQNYLREVCQVSALVYALGKFLGGVDEQELKNAARSTSSSTASAEPMRNQSNSVVQQALPKVKLVVVESELPSRNADSNGGAAASMQFEPVRTAAAAAAAPKKAEAVVVAAKKEEPIKSKAEPLPAAAKKTVEEAAPPAKRAEPVLAKKEDTKPANAAPSTGLSVKERMAAFQKAKN